MVEGVIDWFLARRGRIVDCRIPVFVRILAAMVPFWLVQRLKHLVCEFGIVWHSFPLLSLCGPRALGLLCLLVELARMENQTSTICMITSTHIIIYTVYTVYLYITCFYIDAEYCSNSRLSNLSILQDLWLNWFIGHLFWTGDFFLS